MSIDRCTRRAERTIIFDHADDICFGRAVQAMSNKGKIYLRIASNRGWMHALNPSDDSALFEEIKGEVAADK